MTATIRAFVQADADAVAALWEEAFPNGPSRNAPRAIIERKTARDPGLFFVADADGAVVGAVVAGYDGYRGWLYHLAVAGSHRRQGIATALIEHAVASLTALGCVKVNLQVRRGNEAVSALYAALGWAEDPVASWGRSLAPVDRENPGAGSS